MTQNLEEGRRAAGYCAVCRQGYAVGPHECKLKDALRARSEETYGTGGPLTEAAEVARAALLEIERLERLTAPPPVSEENRKEAARLVNTARERQDFVHLEDGYMYYAPSSVGALAAHQLRILADELDRVNAPWQAQIDRDFGPGGKYAVSVCAAIQPSGENARLQRLGGSRYMCTREHGHAGAHGAWRLVSQPEHAEALRTHRMPTTRFAR